MNGTQLLPENTLMGPVHLAVTDGTRASEFWTRYVGLDEVRSDSEGIHLGVAGTTLIVLQPGASGPVAPRYTGLYHVALHVPFRRDLAILVARLATLEYPQGPTDHTATIATYFSDPDGNGIEITFETPERGRMLILPDGKPVAQLASDGSYRGVTEALDVQDLLGELTEDDDLTGRLSAGTKVGHVHLHLQDIEEGKRFFEDLVGFRQLLHMTNLGMSDFGLDRVTQPHSLAINAWNGSRAKPRPEGTAGLLHWQLLVPDTDTLNEVKDRLAAASWEYRETTGGIATMDPSGNELRILTSS